jgi:hypothetical protein
MQTGYKDRRVEVAELLERCTDEKLLLGATKDAIALAPERRARLSPREKNAVGNLDIGLESLSHREDAKSAKGTDHEKNEGGNRADRRAGGRRHGQGASCLGARPGLLDKTYQVCLAYERRSRGIEVGCEVDLPVRSAFS